MVFVWGSVPFVVGFLIVWWLIAVINHSIEVRAPKCPYCRGTVNKRAVKCVHCGSDLIAGPPKPPEIRGTLTGGWGEMEGRDEKGVGRPPMLR